MSFLSVVHRLIVDFELQVVCYGTVIDVLYQEEMVYMKMKDPTGECILRIIRTHHNVEPQMEHGALPGIA